MCHVLVVHAEVLDAAGMRAEVGASSIESLFDAIVDGKRMQAV